MDAPGIAKILIVIGGFCFALLGGLHAAFSLADDFKPRQFTPLNDEVRRLMIETSVRFSRRINMWLSWIGFNISHGIGVFSFGFIYLLIAVHGFPFLTTFKPLLLFGVILSFVYFLLALRYWFYVPAIGTGIGFSCFVAAYILL